MGSLFSLFAKAVASSAIPGYTAHRLLSSSMLSRLSRISVTAISSLAGLVYFMRVWIQDYYFTLSYNDNRDLTGRTAVVTGGTVDGLGYATAELLYQQGAKVIITVRTKEKGETALRRMREKASSPVDDSRASFVLCDFLSESSVRNCALEIKTKTDGAIDYLVLNAGVAKDAAKQKHSAGTGDKAKKSFDRKVWMTNHVGPWIFAKELMPSLTQAAKRNPSEHPRVVWVSSGAHKKVTIDWDHPFHPNPIRGAITSYGQSKLANIMTAREYQKRVRDLLRKETENTKVNENLDVKCFSVTPGLVWTNVFPNKPLVYPILWLITRSPTQGAQVIKMACLDNDLKGGEYLSNCCVKKTVGVDGCSNDEELWKRLWELTAKQVEEKEYEKFIHISNANKKTN